MRDQQFGLKKLEERIKKITTNQTGNEIIKLKHGQFYANNV